VLLLALNLDLGKPSLDYQKIDAFSLHGKSHEIATTVLVIYGVLALAANYLVSNELSCCVSKCIFSALWTAHMRCNDVGEEEPLDVTTLRNGDGVS
jgi:hypothetical protein